MHFYFFLNVTLDCGRLIISIISYCIIEIIFVVDTSGNSKANTYHKKNIFLYIENFFVIKPKCNSIMDDS